MSNESKTNTTNGHLAPTTLGSWNRLWARVRAQTKEKLTESSERLERPQEAPGATGGDHTCLICLRDRFGGHAYVPSVERTESGGRIFASERTTAMKFSCPGAAAEWFVARAERFKDYDAEIVRPDGTPVTKLTAENIGLGERVSG